MKILAFDSSTDQLSLALSANGEVLTHSSQGGAKASAEILPAVQTLLAQAQMRLADLDGIAFGAGPGAFTGVRVACGVAQGLAFGAGLPVVAVNTLHALGQAAFAENGADKIIATLDARMGELYLAALHKSGEYWQEILPAQLCKPTQLPDLNGENWVLAGNGLQAFDTELTAHFAANLTLLTCQKMPHLQPTALAIIALAKPVFAAGKGVPAAQAQPIYLRNRVALTEQQRAAGERL